MKKRIIAIATVLMMAVVPAMAQVFINDDDVNNRASTDAEMFVNNPGTYDSGEDWFVPVGESLFVLAGLAGAYLIGKRKRDSKE